MRWPSGAASGGVACGIKPDGSPDLGLVVFDQPARWAGAFTTNAAAAACVVRSRRLQGRPVRALVVNSGNANAGTGPEGMAAADATASHAAEVVGCSPDEVLVSSTGPIGVQLPVALVSSGIEAAYWTRAIDTLAFSKAILTTDSGPKAARAAVGGASIVGIAKGAAMVHPNMATMLAFLVTEAVVEDEVLKASTVRAVDASFNRICVDACESTNDSVYVFSTGEGPVVDAEVFEKALHEVTWSLAELIASDAEGATKLVRIRVAGTPDDQRAAELGRAVASSALWRAAVHGADPNWGRILAALGTGDRDLDPECVDISIGGVQVYQQGIPTGQLAAAASEMAADEILIGCRVGDGAGEAEVLSCDLSPEYVSLNAEGTS